MRCRNLPDAGHDKVTLKCSRDLLTKRRDNVTPGRCGDVPPRRLGDVPPRRRWVFHLRLV